MRQTSLIAAAVLFVIGLFLLFQFWPTGLLSDLNNSVETARVAPVRTTTQNRSPRPPNQQPTRTSAQSRTVASAPTNASPNSAANTSTAAQPQATTAERPPLQVQIQQSEIRDLQSQLAVERQELQEQNDTLAALQRQKTQEEEQNALTVASQISTRNLEIQNLTDQLQNLRLSEQDILDATASALRDQSSQMQIVREQIDQSIRSVEDSIAQTQEQIQFWSQNNYSITDRQTQLTNLQALLSQQQQALNDLRVQRLNVASQVLLQRRSIETQAQQQKGNLINDQNQIQTRIADLRAELRQLQEQQARRQLTPVPIADQIRQTQEALNEQVTRVQALESTIQSKQSELSQTR